MKKNRLLNLLIYLEQDYLSGFEKTFYEPFLSHWFLRIQSICNNAATMIEFIIQEKQYLEAL